SSIANPLYFCVYNATTHTKLYPLSLHDALPISPAAVRSWRLHDNMNGMTKRLRTALVMRGHTRPLEDGTVKPRTFEFDFEDGPVIVKAFRRMVRGLEFDVSEMAMTTYLCARAHG